MDIFISPLKLNMLANYIGRFYGIFLNIAIVPYFLSVLGAEPYGLVGLFLVVQGFLSLLDMGMGITLVKAVSQMKHTNSLRKLSELVRIFEMLMLLIASILLICIFYYSTDIASQFFILEELSISKVSTCLILMIFIISTRLFTGVYRSGLIGYEKQIWLNTFSIIINSLKYIGAYFFLVHIKNDVLYFFIYQSTLAIIELFVMGGKFKSFLIALNKIFPSNYKSIKVYLPFMYSTAFITIASVVLTQFDKLLLSHYLTLKEYGYFTLITVVSSGLLVSIEPMTQAVMPRMMSLTKSANDKQVLDLYNKFSQFISIFVMTTVGIAISFPYELLLLWTNNQAAAQWASPILPWFIATSGFMVMARIPFLLQCTYGDLKYYLIYIALLALISMPLLTYAAIYGNAIDVGKAGLLLHGISFILLPIFVHKKLAPKSHLTWLKKNILPQLIVTLILIICFTQIYKFIKHDDLNRITIFIQLSIASVILLASNVLVSYNVRNIIHQIYSQYFIRK